MLRFIVILLSLLMLALGHGGASLDAQTDEKPFILPLAGDPGPDTWLFGQPYGNTVGAYNFGTAWYSAGQGLHFGLDFPAPCGTPLVAVADGSVAFVDNLSRGAGPHNLLLSHPQHNVTTLYGHLREPAPLVPGQTVQQGDFVGYSGDPDGTCDSRPHLHFEVRSMDYFSAYNPVDYIDANWDMLASIGGYSYPLFQGDLDNARRWMALDDQPVTRFGGARLNAYSAAWPLAFNLRPPTNPPLLRPVSPLPAGDWTLRRVGYDQCCWQQWWDAGNPDRFYVIDGGANQLAVILAWSASTGEVVEVVGAAPPAVTSPDGSHAVFNTGAVNTIRDLTTGAENNVDTSGLTPAVSTDNSRLTWTVTSNITVPGQPRANATVYVSAIDGSNVVPVITAPGASGRWLDAERLLVSLPGDGRSVTLSVHNTRDGGSFELGTWTNLRGLSIAPGGERFMFYLTWQDDPSANGVYVIDTQPGASPQRVPWFGGWRWRDAESVYYLPFQPESALHSLHYYHLSTGEDRLLIGPQTGEFFTVMSGAWSVSADGSRILFQNEADRNMWLLESPPAG